MSDRQYLAQLQPLKARIPEQAVATETVRERDDMVA